MAWRGSQTRLLLVEPAFSCRTRLLLLNPPPPCRTRLLLSNPHPPCQTRLLLVKPASSLSNPSPPRRTRLVVEPILENPIGPTPGLVEPTFILSDGRQSLLSPWSPIRPGHRSSSLPWSPIRPGHRSSSSPSSWSRWSSCRCYLGGGPIFNSSARRCCLPASRPAQLGFLGSCICCLCRGRVGQLGTFTIVVATRVAVGFYAGAELWWWLLVVLESPVFGLFDLFLS